MKTHIIHKTFPTLYKQTSTGAIQFWDICVSECVSTAKCPPSEIITNYGQMGTDSPQVTFDLIKNGKNIGRSNETTPFEQAVLEAQSRWEKKKKSGYVETVMAAQNEEIDEIIEGGVNPMLAQSFAKHGHKIKYPCYAQPKIDGIRLLAILKDGKCTLWSRTRKPITGVPHIAREIERLFGDKDLILDGELYNHQFKNDFEKIVSFVRQEEPAEGHEIVQYHIYDIVTNGSFENRYKTLFALFTDLVYKDDKLNDTLRLVTATTIFEENGIESFFNYNIEKGYEGIMLRNKDGLYVNKRSYDLQKVKEFEDSEFPIVGIVEGRGKLAGHAIFVCKTNDGSEFQVKMKGETAKLKECFDNHSLWEGKSLTVQYQGFTSDKIPRFPVGLRIREEE